MNISITCGCGASASGGDNGSLNEWLARDRWGWLTVHGDHRDDFELAAAKLARQDRPYVAPCLECECADIAWVSKSDPAKPPRCECGHLQARHTLHVQEGTCSLACTYCARLRANETVVGSIVIREGDTPDDVKRTLRQELDRIFPEPPGT